jgi:steroid delta-isomerase-like uncharacterized protein
VQLFGRFESEANTMKGDSEMATDLKKQTKAVYSALNKHDIENFLSFHTDDVILESVPDGSVAKGKDELRTVINGYYTGFSDFKMEMTSCIASGNRQCEEFIVTGTHNGTYQGIPASGNKISFRGILVREMKRGKTSRVTNYFDSATMMRQLGISAPQPQVSTIENSLVGTWKLNLAKSRISGPTLQRATIKYGLQGDILRAAVDGVDADGKSIHGGYAAKLDGKDYPMTGAPVADTIALTRIDANTIESVWKKSGKEVSRNRGVVSKDGKTLTFSTNEKNAQGKDIQNTIVCDKQ